MVGIKMIMLEAITEREKSEWVNTAMTVATKKVRAIVTKVNTLKKEEFAILGEIR